MKLRFFLIGEGLAFAGALERILQKGHTVVGIVACAEAEGAALARVGAPLLVKPADPSAFFSEFEFDVLLSINNGYLIRSKTLASARVASINYHNGPLPAYAGLRATAWAVFNGERSHGITWHHIDADIDTGAVLAQRVFPLEPEETTASLNLRCTVAALESFEEVLDRLESGRLKKWLQDSSKRSYFGRTDTLPGGGLIDWRWPVERILRMVRACDWGNLSNNFGSASFLVSHGQACFVRTAIAAEGAAPPGTITARDKETVTVACSGGAVRLTLCHACDLRAGMQLPLLHNAQLAEAGAIQRRCVLSERRWLAKLRRIQRMPARSPGTPAAQQSIAYDGSVEKFLAAVKRGLGANTLVAVEAERDAYGLMQRWFPVAADEPLPENAPGMLKDIFYRHLELGSASDWFDALSIRVYRYGPVELMPAGTLALGSDGRIHFCDASALVEALTGSAAKEHDVQPVDQPRSPREETVLAMISAHAQKEAAVSAIESDEKTTSRGELQRVAHALATRLVSAGVQKEDGVGVLLPAGADFVACALGAMMAGAAYVPLAPNSPSRRLAVEVNEAGIRHILTDKEHKHLLAEMGVPVMLVDEARALENSAVSLPEVFPHDCAYRIFTSGSTGRPKAVEITHGALANLVRHYLSALPMHSRDRMTMLANPIFDASVADIWPILAAGGTLVVGPQRILLHPPELRDWLVRVGVTHAFVTTSVAERLLGMQWPAEVALQSLLMGGDTLHTRPPAGLPFRVINTYGPTENTVDSLWSVVEPGPGRPTIGRPIAGVTAFVAGRDGLSAPAGEIGELVLGGVQVARGYRAQPALTSEKFPVDPDNAKLRLYRTGDKARLNDEGEFEFLGRIDYQLQILGQRVEPEEIEAVLKSDRRVAEAVCIPAYQQGEVTGVIACVVLSDASLDRTTSEESLRRRLREHLPAALQPKAILVCDELPRTASGKVDRRVLTEQMNLSQESRAERGPQSVADLWQQVLPDAPAALDEVSFWELGGDSLGAMRLLAQVETLTSVRVPIAYFLAHPTLNGLLRLTGDRTFSTVVQLRRGAGLPLVCWHTVSGDLEAYQHVANHLKGRPIYGVISSTLAQDGGTPPSIEKIVEDGLAALRRAGLNEAPAMVGYSWGGLLAFEAARQLALAGTPSPYVGLIGTTPPITHRSRARRLLDFLRWGPKRGVQRLLRKDSSAEETLRDSLRRAARLLLSHGAVPETLSWKDPLAETHVRLGLAYHPVPAVPVKLHLFRDLAWRDYRDHLGYVRYDKPDFGWERWAGVKPVLTWVDGNHENLMRGSSAVELSELIEEELVAAEEAVGVEVGLGSI